MVLPPLVWNNRRKTTKMKILISHPCNTAKQSKYFNTSRFVKLHPNFDVLLKCERTKCLKDFYQVYCWEKFYNSTSNSETKDSREIISLQIFFFSHEAKQNARIFFSIFFCLWILTLLLAAALLKRADTGVEWSQI